MSLAPLRWSYAIESNRVAHAVRGGHTLCGLPQAKATTGAPAGAGYIPCKACDAIPPGRATYLDLVEAGPTYRQIDEWTRRGILHADNAECGSGYRKTWPSEEHRVARVMHLLVNVLTKGNDSRGIPPVLAARAARNGGDLGHGVRLVIDREDLEL